MLGSRSIACLLAASLSVVSVNAQAQPRLSADTLKGLESSSNNPSGDFFVDTPEKLGLLIDAFVADNSLASPMALLMAANTALRLKRIEDAAFLFYAGQIRGKFDFERYEISSRANGNNLATYLGFLIHTTGEGINPAIFREPKQFASAIQRIEQWNVVPADAAVYEEYEKEGKGFKVPRAQWATLAESVKTDFLDVFGRRYAKLLNTPEYFAAMRTVMDAEVSAAFDEATLKRATAAMEEMEAIEKRLFPNTPDRQKSTLTITPGELEPIADEPDHEPVDTPVLPTDEVPVRVGGKVPAPKRIKHVEPRFERGLSGSMIAELTIDHDGRVEIINVLRGDLELLEAVDKAVRQWRYEPLVIDGKPVKVVLPVSFTAK